MLVVMSPEHPRQTSGTLLPVIREIHDKGIEGDGAEAYLTMRCPRENKNTPPPPIKARLSRLALREI